MTKFIPYDSPITLLARKFRPIKKLRAWYFKFNTFDEKLNTEGQDPRSFLRFYALGGLNPLLAIKKDFLDTFKPFKAFYYLQKEMLQPFRGLGNVIRGLFNLLVAPLFFLANLPRYIFLGIRGKSLAHFHYNIALSSLKLVGGILDGISSILQGLLQLAFIALNWLLRVPLRAIITGIKGVPTVCQDIQDKVKQLKDRITKDGKNIEDTIFIDSKLQSLWKKIHKARLRKQSLGGIDYDAADQKFRVCDRFTISREHEPKVPRPVTFETLLKSTYELTNDGSEQRTKALSFLNVLQEPHKAPEQFDLPRNLSL